MLRARARLAWTGMAMMMLLQRSPIQWLVAELQFSMAPRMVHVFKWIVGVGLTTAAYNTVTGATGELSSVGNTTVVQGNSMALRIEAERAKINSINLVGELPEGLNSNIGEEGVVTFGVVQFQGAPTEIGEFDFVMTVLTWEDKSTYEGDPVSISFTINVTPEPPEITKAPQSIQVPLGGTAELTVEVDDPENTTYQWQRNVGFNLNQFSNLSGETEAVYRVENATPAVNGAYRVQVLKNGLTETSPSVFLTVSQEENFDSWQFEKFGDQSGSEYAQPGANPDKDAFVNAFEFLFDLDPQLPDSIQFPVLSKEVIQGTDYVVFTFPALIEFPNLDYSFEKTNGLQNGPWVQLLHALDGVLIETDENGTVLKLPSEEAAFIRMKVDTD